MFFLQWLITSKRTSFLKKLPSSIAWLICIRGWSTTLPAPIFKWPTSLFPICPLGRPTASPLASNVVWGYLFHKEIIFLGLAAITALPFSSSR